MFNSFFSFIMLLAFKHMHLISALDVFPCIPLHLLSCLDPSLANPPAQLV